MAKFLGKLLMKASILTGAVYVTIDYGLWEETDKADQVYDQIRSELRRAVSKYYTVDFPIEMVDPPSSRDLIGAAQFYHNRLVMNTAEFIKDIPSKLSSLQSSANVVLSDLLSAEKSNS